jgi:hypothetical protein
VVRTVDSTPETSPAEGFRTLESNDLSDLESSAEPLSTAPLPTKASASLQSTVKGKSGQARRLLKGCCGAFLILALACGVWHYIRYPSLDFLDVRLPPMTEEVVVAADQPASDSHQLQPVADDHLAWEAKLREIDVLRQVLLAKKEEILLLQQNYQYGILELEEEAARLIRRAGIDSLPQALKNHQVELALKSIQRRLAYRDNLEKPLRWIDLGSEELLYLQRRATFDLQLKKIAEGIDLASQMAEIDSALIAYQPTAEKLSINNFVPLKPPLEVIWRRLAEQAKHVDITAEDQRNLDIVAEICSGDLGRLAELSRLTLRGARCLAESGAMQLFLSRLSGMSPAEAGKLCEWPGQWLCLNGVTRLSPELASQLFAWPGEWMSLNGLSEIPAEAGKYLAGWKGRQLELMGLRKSTGIEFLAQWELSGGRLFVPNEIRREIEMFRRTGLPPAQARSSGRS